MTGPIRPTKLAVELTAILAPTFDGITVEASYSEKWSRMSVVFRWPGFANLLPEERFHRLAGVIPTEFRESRLAGYVWLELAPDETVEDYLKLPRSEDVVDKERVIRRRLDKVKFFELLAESMGPSPDENCPGDFTHAEAVMKTKKMSAAQTREAKLIFIGQGAFCDCQILQVVSTKQVQDGS